MHLNGNFLVSYYYPWKFEKFAGYPAGVPAKLSGGYDPLRFDYPYFGLIEARENRWQFPLWNPYNFSGLPLTSATSFTASFFLHIFSFFFSQASLWSLYIISSYFFAFLFMFAYLYYLTKHAWASAFGAGAFAFNTFFIAWNQEVGNAVHAALWLPLVLLSIDHIVENKNVPVWKAFLIGAFILSILAGYIQIALYVFIVGIIYALWKIHALPIDVKKKIHVLGICLGAELVAVLLTLFYTLPFYEMYTQSSRDLIDSKEFLVGHLLPWYAAIQLFIPEFFGTSGTWNHYGFPSGNFYEHTFATGTVALLFALLAICLRKKIPQARFFIILGSVSLLLCTRLPFSEWIFALPIPILSSSLANRLLFLVPFSISVLSAFGLKLWLEEKKGKSSQAMARVFKGLFSFFFLLASTVFIVSFFHIKFQELQGDWTRVALRNMVMPGGILIVSAFFLFFGEKQQHVKRVLPGIFFFLLIFQMGYILHKITSLSPQEFIYPSHSVMEYIKQHGGLYRFWGMEDASVENNIATQMRLFTPEGYDPLVNRRYAQFLKASETAGKWTDQLSRSDAGIYQGNVGLVLENLPFKQKILDLTSTKYILYRPREMRAGILPSWPIVATVSGTSVYENKTALPRVSLIGSSIMILGNQEIFDTLFSPTFNAHEEVVVESINLPKTEPDPTAKATILSYTPNHVVVSAKTQTPQWLLLTDAYYPGWEAMLDGKSAPIYRANFAFRSVLVPPGTHTIEFHYRPMSFLYGLLISSGTLFVLIITLVVRKKIQ